MDKRWQARSLRIENVQSGKSTILEALNVKIGGSLGGGSRTNAPSEARRTRWDALENVSSPLALAASIFLCGILLAATGVLAASEHVALIDQTTLIDLAAIVVAGRGSGG